MKNVKRSAVNTTSSLLASAMVASALVASTLLAGCASTSASKASAESGSAGSAMTTQTILGAGGVGGATAVNLVNDTRSVKTDVSLAMADAWKNLIAAYDALGIKVTDLNEPGHALGNPGLRARRRIGDVQLRTALNCGGDNSAPNSETFDLTLNIRSVLTPAGNGVQLETYIRGTGVNALTNNTNIVQCYSLGVLEKRIADAVAKPMAPKKP